MPEEAPPPPPNYSPPPPSQAPATPPDKKSNSKLIIIIISAIAVFGIAAFALIRLFSGSSDTAQEIGQAEEVNVVLSYWGLWESAEVMKPVIDEFHNQYPGVRINYLYQSGRDYQERVKTVLESSDPPDIVRLHTSWIPVVFRQLSMAPSDTISVTEINNNFPPIISRLLIVNDQVLGIPMTSEGLALYVNTSMFQQKSLTMPRTWEDVLSSAKALKEADPLTGKITRAGIAMGLTGNVDHWPDIVSLMLLQAGVKMTDPRGAPAEEALNFYVDFVRKHRLWDETLPNSTLAFANEKVAMMFAPSWRAYEIKSLNPSLTWQVIPVPQLPDSDTVTWASPWFEAVPKNSKNQKEAWQFLNFLSSAKAQQLLTDSAISQRGFPQAPANTSASTTYATNDFIKTYSDSFATSRTFYTASLTQDSETNINSQLIKYLEDAINSLARGQDNRQVFETLGLGFQQILSRYGIVPAVGGATQ
jgi:multiple sugar transport system substrate-binding protein